MGDYLTWWFRQQTWRLNMVLAIAHPDMIDMGPQNEQIQD